MKRIAQILITINNATEDEILGVVAVLGDVTAALQGLTATAQLDFQAHEVQAPTPDRSLS